MIPQQDDRTEGEMPELPTYYYDIDGSLRMKGRESEYGGVGEYVTVQDARAAIAADRRARQGEPVGEFYTRSYICRGCGAVYIDEKVTKCDCMPDVQEYDEGAVYRAATKAAAPADAPSEPIMANGLPVERAQMDWACRFLSENSVFDGNDILQAWNALVAFYVARRASSVPAIPGTGGEKPQAQGHRGDWYLMANARRLTDQPIRAVRAMSNWAFASELFATGSTNAHRICKDAGIDPDGLTVTRAAPSHPLEAKAGEDA